MVAASHRSTGVTCGTSQRCGEVPVPRSLHCELVAIFDNTIRIPLEGNNVRQHVNRLRLTLAGVSVSCRFQHSGTLRELAVLISLDGAVQYRKNERSVSVRTTHRRNLERRPCDVTLCVAWAN